MTTLIKAVDKRVEKVEMSTISNDNLGRMSDVDSNASEQFFKRKMVPSMSSPKESSSRNQSGCNMMPGCCSGKENQQNKR